MSMSVWLRRCSRRFTSAGDSLGLATTVESPSGAAVSFSGSLAAGSDAHPVRSATAASTLAMTSNRRIIGPPSTLDDSRPRFLPRLDRRLEHGPQFGRHPLRLA